jgi:medium-chain acyl-CoA synthetase
MAHSSAETLKRPKSFNFATDVVDYWAKKDSSLLALHWVNQQLQNEQRLTFQYFSQTSHRISQIFQKLEVQQGETCILILPRLPEWWSIATACLRSGVVLCPCTTLLVDKDIEYRLQISSATCFIGDTTSVSKVLKVRKSCPALRTIIQIGGKIPDAGVTDFHELLSTVPKDVHFPAPSTLTTTSPALTFFTSGTTGPPKMVLHNQISYPLAHTQTGKHWLRLQPGSLYWNLSEQGWAKAAWSFFGAWNMGAALFICDDRGAFNPQRVLETLHRFPITVLCAPPTAYRQLVLDESQAYFAKNRPKTLIHCTGAGEPLNESVIRTWEKMTDGIQIYDGYGQTETILVCANQKANKVKPGSMGKPIPGVPLVIIDNDGKECEVGKEGDIAIQIDEEMQEGKEVFFGIFDGYIDKSTGRLDRRIKRWGGKVYYLSGDRASRDEDGYFWFVGRSDDVINSSGYRIGPFEVESVLKMHPAVVESAVVASPDPQRDEVVKAFVVLTESANKEQDKEALKKKLQDFCKENAAPYKYPRKIDFVDASFLPKTISGKIKRAELKKMEKDKYKQEKGSRL